MLALDGDNIVSVFKHPDSSSAATATAGANFSFSRAVACGASARPNVAADGRPAGAAGDRARWWTPLRSQASRRRQRAVAYQRAKRAAAKQAKAERAPAETSNGKAPAKVSAAALWEHAELLTPKTPWRVVAKEFGANEAQILDCYRARDLPPGVAVNAIEGSWSWRRRRDNIRRALNCWPWVRSLTD
jgi:hypothetical protein